MSTANKAQHTPGPWRWAQDEFNAKNQKNNQLVFALLGPPSAHPPVDVFDYHTIMKLHWNSVRGENLINATPTDANAALIAAAPELLEALEALVDHMVTINDGGDAENNPDVVRGLSAIAKARGTGQ